MNWTKWAYPPLAHLTPTQLGLAPPSQVFVPVRSDGCYVFDNGGDMIAVCFSPELAATVAALLNADAKTGPGGVAA